MRKLLSSPKYKYGFTLIELLIVVSIIVILIAIGAVSYTTAQKKARDGQRQSDLQKIAAGLEEFFADYGQYPDTLACLEGSSCTPPNTNNNVYISKVPTDPQSGLPYSSYTLTDVDPGPGVNNQKYQLQATLEGGGTYSIKSPAH